MVPIPISSVIHRRTSPPGATRKRLPAPPRSFREEGPSCRAVAPFTVLPLEADAKVLDHVTLATAPDDQQERESRDRARLLPRGWWAWDD
jgi:hypothetical protein